MLQLDAFSQVVQAVRLSSSVFSVSELTSPWAVRVEGGHGATFHVVLEGRLFLEIENEGERHELRRGDCFLLVREQAHTAFDSPGATPVDFGSVVRRETRSGRKQLRLGGGGAAARVLSGCFHFDVQPHNPLLKLLPPFLHIRSEGTPAPWLTATLQFLDAEEQAGLFGSGAVVTRLGDILFVQMLRTYLEQAGPDHRGWLGAMSHPQLSRVLQQMHQRPNEPWRLTTLARVAGMGRSLFADQFREMVGMPPMAYLKEWRLQKAAELLRCSQEPIKEVAGHAGYDCEVSFGKAFRKWSGQPPAQYRRRANSNGAVSHASGARG